MSTETAYQNYEIIVCPECNSKQMVTYQSTYPRHHTCTCGYQITDSTWAQMEPTSTAERVLAVCGQDMIFSRALNEALQLAQCLHSAPQMDHNESQMRELLLRRTAACLVSCEMIALVLGEANVARQVKVEYAKLATMVNRLQQQSHVQNSSD